MREIQEPLPIFDDEGGYAGSDDVWCARDAESDAAAAVWDAEADAAAAAWGAAAGGGTAAWGDIAEGATAVGAAADGGTPAAGAAPAGNAGLDKGARSHCQVCRPHKLSRYRIDIDRCIRCADCVRACPAHAIAAGPTGRSLRILDDHCVACGACYEVCPTGAVQAV